MDLVTGQFRDCGGTIHLARGHEPFSDDSANALQNMAEFKREEVTTILWTGHGDLAQPQAAASIGYTPEIIVLGQPDGLDNNIRAGPFGHPAVMKNAWAVTNHTLQGPPRREQCGLAVVEGKPEASDNDVFFGCERYPHMMLLFTGIQVAGPRLNPSAVENGLRAIPGNPSSDPKSPACFFRPGDYTCVKDAAAEWWDPQSKAAARRSSEEGFVGCWRMTEGGKRYLAGSWPNGDVPAQKTNSDPCNSA